MPSVAEKRCRHLMHRPRVLSSSVAWFHEASRKSMLPTAARETGGGAFTSTGGGGYGSGSSSGDGNGGDADGTTESTGTPGGAAGAGDGSHACADGTTRSCAAAPLDKLGACALDIATCADGVWVGCADSKGDDSCAAGNDDDCDGLPNEGCACVRPRLFRRRVSE